MEGFTTEVDLQRERRLATWFKTDGEAIVEFEHDGHHVHLIELPTSSGRRWKFSVVVCWETEGIRRVRTLSCIGRAFETAHSARLEGIEFTKRWIDEGKPAPH